MWTKRRHKIFHFFFRWLANLVFRLKYNFRSKKVKLGKEPHLILFNHPTNFDPIFVGSTFNRPTYFIANEDLFNVPFVSKLLNYLVAPIPKKKSVRDTTAIKTAIKVVKEGGNIGVSPEGNRTYSGRINHIDMAIVKFARLLKVPIVLYTIEGGFGVNPRFSSKVRKGRINGSVKEILTVEEIKNMDNDELLKRIIDILDVDDTLTTKVKGNNLAEDLESVFYVCPICNKMHTLNSKGDKLTCSECSLEVSYTNTLKFETSNKYFKFNTVNDYYLWQNEYMKNCDFNKLIFEDLNIDFIESHVKKKKSLIYQGTLTLDIEGITIKNETNFNHFKLSDIESLAVLYHNILIINLKDRKYHFKGCSKFNALKYLNLFTLLKDQEQNIETKYLGI